MERVEPPRTTIPAPPTGTLPADPSLPQAAALPDAAAIDTLAAFRLAAARRIDPDAWAYYEATAGDPEDLLNRYADERAWARMTLLPRYLRGLGEIEATTSVAELSLPTPLVVCPTAAHQLAHPDAELATAAGAGAAGALYVMSNSANRSAGQVGAAATGPWWMQIYLMADRERSGSFLDEAREAGARAIVLTVDYGGRIGWSKFRSSVQQRLTVESGTYPDLGWQRMTRAAEQALTPADITWVRDRSGLPVWAKGILHPADAVEAIEAGAAGIMVSNHGRRQLDGVIPAAQALPAVLDAVGGAVPVMVDGGIRSGTDVLRALSLGACAVGIGRPALWGLALGGADGVRTVLELLTEELLTAMASVGVARVSDIGPHLLTG